eukprot:gene11235-15076_t
MEVFNPSVVQDMGNYTCDELFRWIGTEKHYSNNNKKVLFDLFTSQQQNCLAYTSSVIKLHGASYGYITETKSRSYFITNNRSNSIIRGCKQHDEYSVVYLSNFSLNNNFSHFLHSLLRLFCALLDGDIIRWDESKKSFVQTTKYSLWIDENFKLTEEKLTWLKSFGGEMRILSKIPPKECVSSSVLIYGSGCVRLLPPEKWFGYPSCRAKDILPSFGVYMRQHFMALGTTDLRLIDEQTENSISNDPGLRVSFAVRAVGAETGRRSISNLATVQALIKKSQHIRSSMENITFEHLDVPSIVRYMAGVHIFVSVHGAGMTNMFFMNPGSAVVEIIPYPLCNCRSPDYFYGVGGYYHGSSVAQGIKHYAYCVSAEDTKWHKVPSDLKNNGKCSWKHLHAVDSVYIDPPKFVSLMRNVERDLVVAGTIILTRPIINISPHANG